MTKQKTDRKFGSNLKVDFTKIKFKDTRGLSYLAFPHGLTLPSVLRQKKRDIKDEAKMKAKADSKCCVCGKLDRTYVDKQTRKVTCSLDCYKKAGCKVVSK